MLSISHVEGPEKRSWDLTCFLQEWQMFGDPLSSSTPGQTLLIYHGYSFTPGLNMASQDSDPGIHEHSVELAYKLTRVKCLLCAGHYATFAITLCPHNSMKQALS